MMIDKRRVLFVDDEAKVLQGIKRMLLRMRKEWDMSFATSGQEALDIMESKKMDIIVSDMRMPEMDGAQLLHEVSLRHPKMVRIVLSGQADKEEVLKSIGPSHQYLSKPCDSKMLKKTVTRAMSLRHVLDKDQVRAVVSKINTLPSLPGIYDEIRRLFRKPCVNLSEMASVIEKDIAMTAKILQIVNSAYFGFSEKIDSVKRAVSYLGFETIKSLILVSHIFEKYKNKEMEGMLTQIWDHSWHTAMVAKQMAYHVGASEEIARQAFTTGILHDIGYLVYAANFPKKFQLYIEKVTNEPHKSLEMELSIFGTSHEKIGAYLLGIWGLPDAIVEAVTWYREPYCCVHDEMSPLTFLHLASALEKESCDFDYCFPKPDLSSHYLKGLNLMSYVPELQKIHDSFNETLEFIDED